MLDKTPKFTVIQLSYLHFCSSCRGSQWLTLPFQVKGRHSLMVHGLKSTLKSPVSYNSLNKVCYLFACPLQTTVCPQTTEDRSVHHCRSILNTFAEACSLLALQRYFCATSRPPCIGTSLHVYSLEIAVLSPKAHMTNMFTISNYTLAASFSKKPP